MLPYGRPCIPANDFLSCVYLGLKDTILIPPNFLYDLDRVAYHACPPFYLFMQ